MNFGRNIDLLSNRFDPITWNLIWIFGRDIDLYRQYRSMVEITRVYYMATEIMQMFNPDRHVTWTQIRGPTPT